MIFEKLTGGHFKKHVNRYPHSGLPELRNTVMRSLKPAPTSISDMAR